MITTNNLILLQDMGDDSFTDIVVFDNEVDMKAIKEATEKLWDDEDGWTYDDLLEELDKFGSYTIIPTRTIETIEY